MYTRNHCVAEEAKVREQEDDGALRRSSARWHCRPQPYLKQRCGTERHHSIHWSLMYCIQRDKGPNTHKESTVLHCWATVAEEAKVREQEDDATFAPIGAGGANLNPTRTPTFVPIYVHFMLFR